MIETNTIYHIINRHLPRFRPTGELKLQRGGNLNNVWRIEGTKSNLIIKWAPPYIAANPEVPLNPQRIHFEARALELFKKGNLLGNITNIKIRPPELIHFDADYNLIIMEDLGQLPTIIKWVKTEGTPDLGSNLGEFIGLVHKKTLGLTELGFSFQNQNVQQTRCDIQYNGAADYAQKAGITDTNQLKAKCTVLGDKLLEPGKCLTMGDLWPPSLLVDKGNLRIIDWEFSHFGHPLQDVGHFAAHCWMQAHCSSQKADKQLLRDLWNQFWQSYKQALSEDYTTLFTKAEHDYMTTHIGAEILIRATGPFKAGYVFEPYAANHQKIKYAADKARQLILKNDIGLLWARITT
jgi:5-methylthioribose kinase